MSNVTEKLFWAKGTGLLPIHLSPISGKEQYILLDGGLYDFCLDLSNEESDPSDYYSAAWSSDVKNYIAIHGVDAIVYNWSRQRPESVPLSIVKDKFSAFLKILNSNSYRTSDDVTPFILGLFAQLRNLTLEQREPIDALNLLFKLLISLEEDDLSQATCDRWGIDNVIEPLGFDALRESIRQGVRNISPNLDFILRHGSGPLFETAHREALYFDPQFNLFGEISSRLEYANQPKYTGIHYTPRYLVRSIVENALKSLDLNRPSLTILDPACGSGAFLQEVLKQLRENNNYHGQIFIKGFDISPMAEQSAKFLLGYENRHQWGDRISVKILRQDSLIEDWGNNDLILMNPPFISSELIKDTETKQRVNDLLEPLHMKKRPNMAAAFFYRAMQSLNEGGVLGAVLPSSILIQDQYQPLRNAAVEIMRLETVAQLGNFVFKEALADTSFVLTKKQNSGMYVPLNIWCSNREKSAFEAMKGWRKMRYDNATSRIEEHYNIYTPSRFPLIIDNWKVLPQEDDYFSQNLKSRKVRGDLKPLQDIFIVRQGVIKGNRDLFELSKTEYESIPKEERWLFRPVASSQTIDNGHVRDDSFLWYPYSKAGLLIRSEEKLQQYPKSFQWLFPYKDVVQTRKGVNNWWELTRPRSGLFSKKESILCSKRSGDIHCFAIAKPSMVVEEGNVFLFRNDCYYEEDKYFYLAFFSSIVFHRMLSLYARPLNAGFDLGGIQIKDIPIVDVNLPGIRESVEYRELVRYSKEYAEGYKGRRDYFDKLVLSFF